MEIHLAQPIYSKQVIFNFLLYHYTTRKCKTCHGCVCVCGGVGGGGGGGWWMAHLAHPPKKAKVLLLIGVPECRNLAWGR